MGAQCKTPMTCGMQILEILFSKHPLPPPPRSQGKKNKTKKLGKNQWLCTTRLGNLGMSLLIKLVYKMEYFNIKTKSLKFQGLKELEKFKCKVPK